MWTSLTKYYRWQTALYNSASPYQPSPETGLIRILPGLLLMLGSNLDLLPKLLSLLDSYLLLDPVGISQVSLQQTVKFTTC